MKSQNTLHRVNQFTGGLFGPLSLNQTPHNMLAFGPSDALYTGNRTSTNTGVTNGFQLKQINLSTGIVTLLGSNSALHIGALAWDLRTYTPPGVANLSLDKTVDNPSPANWGQAVTFTITVSNTGPDDATGVKVKDQLPSGFTYVSDNSTSTSTTYNSSTGIWNVGTIADGDSKALEIVGSVQPSGSYMNVAEVIDSTSYDSNSVPASGEGDTIDDFTLTPTADPDVDAAADVLVSGPTKANATSKGFTVLITNVGTQLINAGSPDLSVEINGNSGAATCKPFSAFLKPGRSVRVHCSANIASVGGVDPGETVTYSATVDVSGDGFTSNDTDAEVRTAS
jgi:large repetitive protein